MQRVLELEAEIARLEAELHRVRRDAEERVADADRRHRRELVPVSQSVAVFGRRPSIFDEQ